MPPLIGRPGYAPYSWSHFAANTKSLSVSPSILCVQITTPTFPHARWRSG